MDYGCCIVNGNDGKCLTHLCVIFVDEQFGWTPLFSACSNGRLGIVKMLLSDSRVEINREDKVKWVAYCWCAVVDNVCFRAYGFVFCVCEQGGCTPFYFACKYGYAEVVKHLLSNGRIEINREDKVKPIYYC